MSLLLGWSLMDIVDSALISPSFLGRTHRVLIDRGPVQHRKDPLAVPKGAVSLLLQVSALWRSHTSHTDLPTHSPVAWLLSRFVFDVLPLRIVPTIIVSSMYVIFSLSSFTGTDCFVVHIGWQGLQMMPHTSSNSSSSWSYTRS